MSLSLSLTHTHTLSLSLSLSLSLTLSLSVKTKSFCLQLLLGSVFNRTSPHTFDVQFSGTVTEGTQQTQFERGSKECNILLSRCFNGGGFSR
jgi:hypothetical protein